MALLIFSFVSFLFCWLLFLSILFLYFVLVYFLVLKTEVIDFRCFSLRYLFYPTYSATELHSEFKYIIAIIATFLPCCHSLTELDLFGKYSMYLKENPLSSSILPLTISLPLLWTWWMSLCKSLGIQSCSAVKPPCCSNLSCLPHVTIKSVKSSTSMYVIFCYHKIMA